MNIVKLLRRKLCMKAEDFLIHRNRKPIKDDYYKNQFLDTKVVTAIAGKGGDGMISLLREFCNPYGGPSGGDGGCGGHVIFKCCSETMDLSNINSIVRGNNGQNGMSKGMNGSNGDDIIVQVPTGTVVTCYQTNEILADLVKDNEILIAVRGGEGGKGNKFFLSQEHRAPTLAECGGIGQTRKLILEVKLLADIGLIGIPNAGKSTLLRALTRAKPKVAPYAFTTLRPHVGKIDFTNTTWTPITICDIPGIIKDSSKNRGLGLEFLRHIERCRILAFIIDLSNNPIDQFSMLCNELNLYRPILLSIPRMIICNKIDLPGTRISFENFKAHLRKLKDFSSLVAISAMNSINLTNLVSEMNNLRNSNLMQDK